MKEYICPCCGVKKEFDDGFNEDISYCQPCSVLADMAVHTIPVHTPICCLDADLAFSGLTEKEKLYSYWLGRASWEGAVMCLTQTSPESLPIFCTLITAFSAQPVGDLVGRALAAGVSTEEVEEVMMFCAAFFGNMGNYKSFGDTKVTYNKALHVALLLYFCVLFVLTSLCQIFPLDGLVCSCRAVCAMQLCCKGIWMR